MKVNQRASEGIKSGVRRNQDMLDPFG